jgi:Raf kinase inhibitor-like YbhB/YbcL family protein
MPIGPPRREEGFDKVLQARGGADHAAAGGTTLNEVAMFAIRSPAFSPDGAIPARHTCDGEDVSPALTWTDPPPGTRSFALIVDDPDAPDPAAPKKLWVHWIRYNIPADARSLPEGAGNAAPSGGARDAVTDAKATGYHGPCPPIGRHRYYFHLFALDAVLPDLGDQAKRREVDAAIEQHVLATAVVMGTYAHPAGKR